MPNAVVQFEQRLEPFIEWFHGLAASRVKLFAARALVELASPLTRFLQLEFIFGRKSFASGKRDGFEPSSWCHVFP